MTRERQAGSQQGMQPWRYWAILGMLAICGAALVARAVYLQVIDQAFLEKQGDARILRTAKLAANRGMVLIKLFPDGNTHMVISFCASMNRESPSSNSW